MKTFHRNLDTTECRNCEFPESAHVWRCAACHEALPVEGDMPTELHTHSHSSLFCPYAAQDDPPVIFQGYVTGTSADGRHLVILAEDGTVFDVHSKQNLWKLRAHNVRIAIEDLGNPDKQT